MRISKHKTELLILVLGAVTIGALLILRIKGEKVDDIDAGAVIDIEVMATAWMEPNSTRIETDKGIFYVPGVISSMKGVTVTVEKYTSGQHFLCMSDRESCLMIIGE